eukprot:1020500-Amphidinium_carterae.1
MDALGLGSGRIARYGVPLRICMLVGGSSPMCALLIYPRWQRTWANCFGGLYLTTSRSSSGVGLPGSGCAVEPVSGGVFEMMAL